MRTDEEKLEVINEAKKIRADNPHLSTVKIALLLGVSTDSLRKYCGELGVEDVPKMDASDANDKRVAGRKKNKKKQSEALENEGQIYSDITKAMGGFSKITINGELR